MASPALSRSLLARIPRRAQTRLHTAGAWLRNHYPAIFLALFLGLLLLPLQSFPGNFSDFPSQFWGYDALVRGYSAVRLNVLKDTIFADVFARPGNWLVYSGESSIDDFQNVAPFTASELARIQQNLDGINQRLSQQGIKFLVVIVPGKNTIYPEQMPSEIPVLHPQSQTDQILAYMQQHGQAKILDVRPVLNMARQQHPVYYATDTHWNPYGILAAYSAVLGALQKDFPALQPHTLADFRYVSTGPGAGDLSSKWLQGLVQEDMFELQPRFDRRTVQFTLTQGTAMLPGRMVATYNPDASLPRAVIFHDSFFNGMMPFLSDHFSWAIYHWAFQVDETLVAGEKPNIVIYEVTDRYLTRLLEMVKK